jgi:hypothetical protein
MLVLFCFILLCACFSNGETRTILLSRAKDSDLIDIRDFEGRQAFPIGRYLQFCPSKGIFLVGDFNGDKESDYMCLHDTYGKIKYGGDSFYLPFDSPRQEFCTKN